MICSAARQPKCLQNTAPCGSWQIVHRQAKWRPAHWVQRILSDRITLDHNSFVVFMSSVYESSKIVAHRHMSLLPRLPRLQSSRFEVLVTSLLCVSWRWRLLKQGWAHRGRHAGSWNHVSQHRIRGRLRVWFFKPLSVKCGKPHNKPSQIGVYYCVYIYIYIYSIPLYVYLG